MTEDKAIPAAGEKLGYAFTYLDDFDENRKIQVSFGLKPGAPLEAFHEELEKLRKASDRQRAHISLKNALAKIEIETLLMEAIEVEIAAAEERAEAQVQALNIAPKTMPTAEKNQKLVIMDQARNLKQSKQIDLAKHQTNIKISKFLAAKAQKEIDEG